MQRGEQQTPSILEEQIIVLRAEINDLKSRTSTKNVHKDKRDSKKRERQAQREKSERSCQSEMIHRDNDWMAIPPVKVKQKIK